MLLTTAFDACFVRMHSCRLYRLRGGSHGSGRPLGRSAGANAAEDEGGAGASRMDLTGLEQLSLGEMEEVALPSLDAFNVSDEMSVLKVKLALAQAEVLPPVWVCKDIICSVANVLMLQLLTICEVHLGARPRVQITRLKATVYAIANPQGLYFVEGVQLDVPESMLKGWTCYYHAPYYNATTTDEIFGPELG
jgi:hypothetical protein